MPRTLGLTLSAALLAALGCDDRSPQRASAPPAGYTLVWSDDFESDGLPDTTKWSYDVGDGCPGLCGWGNNELQYYTAGRGENARVQGGHLIIDARKERFESRDFSSARLVSRGKGDWLYGRVEVRVEFELSGTDAASAEELVEAFTRR